MENINCDKCIHGKLGMIEYPCCECSYEKAEYYEELDDEKDKKINNIQSEINARENQFNILMNKCNEHENTIIELSEVNGRLVRLVDKQERLINKLKNYVLKEE